MPCLGTLLRRRHTLGFTPASPLAVYGEGTEGRPVTELYKGQLATIDAWRTQVCGAFDEDEHQALVELSGAVDRLWERHVEELPFGWEFLSSATFREINYGAHSARGNTLTIAGKNAIRAGFVICSKAWQLQAGAEPKHAPSCKAKNSAAQGNFIECVYLYRAFDSEAVRILLPVMDFGSNREIQSLVAGIRTGLRLYFGGRVDHVRMTLESEPVKDSMLRRQFLVLYDAVPGGTGWLVGRRPRVVAESQPEWSSLVNSPRIGTADASSPGGGGAETIASDSSEGALGRTVGRADEGDISIAGGSSDVEERGYCFPVVRYSRRAHARQDSPRGFEGLFGSFGRGGACGSEIRTGVRIIRDRS